MITTNLKTIEALEAFLEGNQLAAFAVPGNKTQRYDFVPEFAIIGARAKTLKLKKGDRVSGCS